MKLDNEDGVIKIKDIGFDFLLKQKIADLFDAGITHNINGDLKKSFEAFKGLMLVLIGYEHNTKNELLELTDVLTDYFDNLQTKPNRKDQIVTKQQEVLELRVLLDRFIGDIIKAYTDLGLWLSTKVEYNDLDKMLSAENFNSEISTLLEKRSFLKNLDKDLIIDSLTPNAVHDVFGRLELKKVLEE